MYQNNNDDRSQYEYHYNYRPNYTEPIHTAEPVVEFTETKKHGRGKRIVAGALAAVILVGASFGTGWFVQKNIKEAPSTQLTVSERPKTEVGTVSIKGGEKLSYPEIYAANVDSCVSINVSSTSYNFFGQAVQSASSGSGFIITDDGYIVTNYHVIEGGTSVSVTLNNGTTYEAQLIGYDESLDTAVLKVDAEGLVPVI